jgi:ubiquinone biosynthesis monooxygenase Coq7
MIDRLIIEFDKSLRTLFADAPTTRKVPGTGLSEADLSESERAHAAALMRVNHSGEICAQALYQGQSLTSTDAAARDALRVAAYEETEHLNWTSSRIRELNGRTSALNPFWYLGALGIGVVAGKCGNTWNLGFLAETERQVEAHLLSHLDRLSDRDIRSRAIIDQMKVDEAAHAGMAREMGGRGLPLLVRTAMKVASGVMTRVAYYV